MISTSVKLMLHHMVMGVQHCRSPETTLAIGDQYKCETHDLSLKLVIHHMVMGVRHCHSLESTLATGDQHKGEIHFK